MGISKIYIGLVGGIIGMLIIFYYFDATYSALIPFTIIFGGCCLWDRLGNGDIE